MISILQKSKGFTLIEALVSLALFAIAFSGLYFFFGMAQQANNNSEKRIYLNLMTNQIIETIHAEAFRADGDILSPFVTPASYNANLSDCSTYSAPDVRHTWCTELNAAIGPHKGVHADEVRTVEVVKDETNLIVNVTLVADGGIGDKNLIKTFLSRKIVPPRVDPPSVACIDRHNTQVSFMKAWRDKCEGPGYGNLDTKLYRIRYWGGVKEETYWRSSCSKFGGQPYYRGLPSGVGFSYYRPGYFYTQYNRVNPPHFGFQFNQHLIWQMYEDINSPGTIYGPKYSWGELQFLRNQTKDYAGNHISVNSHWGNTIRMLDPNEDGKGGIPGTIVVAATLSMGSTTVPEMKAAYPKYLGYGAGYADANAMVISCCPTEKKANGDWKACGVDYRSNPDRVPFLLDSIRFSSPN